MKTLKMLCISGVLLAVGCHSGKRNGGASDSTVVARVGDRTITAGDLQAKIDAQPAFLRARFQKLDARKQLLDEMVRFEVLAAEARREGLDQDPQLQDTFQKLLVQRLIQKRSEEHPKASEAELRAYYDAHKSEFIRPEKLRVSQIFLAAAANDPKRTKVEGEAKRLLTDIRAKEAGPVKTEFATTARRRSEDLRSRDLGGDLGLVTRDELAAQWGPGVASAAEGLKAIGDTVEVSSAKGFHLIKLTARIPGMNRDFDAVRALLESRVALEQRAKSVDSFVASVREKAHVEVDDKALAAMGSSDSTPKK